MPNWKGEETVRELLTEEKIRKDIRRGAATPLIMGACLLPLAALTCFASGSLLRLLGDYPAAFWILAVLLGSLCAFVLFVAGTLLFMGIRDLIAAGRFKVTADTLESREEGHKQPGAALILNPALCAVLYPHKPYCFTFSRGTYKADARQIQFGHSPRFSAKTEDMFRHGDIGDLWWVAAAGSGRILKIYPKDMFEYRDVLPR